MVIQDIVFAQMQLWDQADISASVNSETDFEMVRQRLLEMQESNDYTTNKQVSTNSLEVHNIDDGVCNCTINKHSIHSQNCLMSWYILNLYPPVFMPIGYTGDLEQSIKPDNKTLCGSTNWCIEAMLMPLLFP